MSVRNRCVFEVFGGVFVLSLCFLEFSVGVRDSVIGLSQISSFSPLSSGIALLAKIDVFYVTNFFFVIKT